MLGYTERRLLECCEKALTKGIATVERTGSEDYRVTVGVGEYVCKVLVPQGNRYMDVEIKLYQEEVKDKGSFERLLTEQKIPIKDCSSFWERFGDYYTQLEETRVLGAVEEFAASVNEATGPG